MSDTAGTAEAAATTPSDTLKKALAAAGVGLAADQVEALIAGVAAAPAGGDAEAWMRLVAPEPSAGLREQLASALAKARAALANAEAEGDPIGLLRAELKSRGVDGFENGYWVFPTILDGLPPSGTV